MRKNNIPRLIRLYNMIRKLNLRQSNGWTCKVFYPQCVHCNITNVQLSIDGDHYVGCSKRGLGKEIKYWDGLIKEEHIAEEARRFNALAIFDIKPIN